MRGREMFGAVVKKNIESKEPRNITQQRLMSQCVHEDENINFYCVLEKHNGSL